MSPQEASVHAGCTRPPIVVEPPSQEFMCLKGVAMLRGECARPRTMAAARLAVEDLSRDAVEIERLAVVALKAASVTPTCEPHRTTRSNG